MELENAKALIDNRVRTDGAAALADMAAEANPDAQGQIAPNSNPLYQFTKRLFDIVASGMALIILSPVMLLTALAIKIEDPNGAVFYKQQRIGRQGTTFWCHKFRYMENIGRMNEILGYIRTCFCMIQTINFHNFHFRHQVGGISVVEVGEDSE